MTDVLLHDVIEGIEGYDFLAGIPTGAIVVLYDKRIASLNRRIPSGRASFSFQ